MFKTLVYITYYNLSFTYKEVVDDWKDSKYYNETDVYCTLLTETCWEIYQIVDGE